MSRRIILFGPLPPPYGGVSIYLSGLLAHLTDANVRFWSYTRPKANSPNVRYVAHRRFGTIAALIAEGSNARILDATHFHLEYPNAPLLFIWLTLKSLLRFEWYKNVHDGSLPKRYQHFSALRRRLFHRALKSVDVFVVVSEELRRWFVEELRVKQSVVVIPGLLPSRSITGATQLSAETARLLEFYFSQDKQVCSIGAFIPSYGFRDVAEAVEEVRQRSGKDIGLLLLDGDFARDEQYREEVLWERDWITVLEKISNPEIYSILKRADVFVRAFADESYGISRIEALWCGIPVIATRAGETRGMLLYDFGDAEQLVTQLQAVLLYPIKEDANPWAAHYREEAEKNLKALKELLGIPADS